MFEWAWKHAKRSRAAGLQARRNQLAELLDRPKWTKASPEAVKVPLAVRWTVEGARSCEPFGSGLLPSHITEAIVADVDKQGEPEREQLVLPTQAGAPSEWELAAAQWEAAEAELDSELQRRSVVGDVKECVTTQRTPAKFASRPS